MNVCNYFVDAVIKLLILPHKLWACMANSLLDFLDGIEPGTDKKR